MSNHPFMHAKLKATRGPLPFSGLRFAGDRVGDHDPALANENAHFAHDDVAALATMSRRIQDLARELKCLGYFDDGDRPRAA